METKQINEKLITRYLLGDLSEEEQAAVEDHAFSDKDYLREVLAVESDLIDEYIRGELSESERRQFETRFVTSAERRNKIEFARALARVAPATEAEVAREYAVRTPLPSLKDAFNEFFVRLNPFVKLSMAAAAVVIAAGFVWLMLETTRLRNDLSTARSEQQARSNQIRELEQRNQELAAQVESEKQKAQGSNPPNVPPPQIERQEKPSTGVTIATLLLVPGIPRSAVNRPKLVLDQNASLARLQVGLEPGDEYKGYRVEVRTRAGQEVWTQNDLRAHQTRQGRSVVVNIPARLVETGEFELTLKGFTSSGTGENIGYYYFDVLKK